MKPLLQEEIQILIINKQIKPMKDQKKKKKKKKEEDVYK